MRGFKEKYNPFTDYCFKPHFWCRPQVRNYFWIFYMSFWQMNKVGSLI